VESLKLEIDVNSLWTQFDNLTAHLKNADFFETDKYPMAKFESTSITANDQGMKITGNLTLHGVTNEVSFIAKGKLNQNGLLAISEFKLDRSLFGMNQMLSGVDKMVSLKFVIGQKTEVKASAPGRGTSKKSTPKTSPSTQFVLFAPNMT
ncbi:MAG: YceI family protein, partial [Planctomycetota bacterium]